MDLSVIVVNYNVRHFLEQCLFSVRNAARDISCEIIVVDNNSADGSCSMVSTTFPEVILIRNYENRGFSAGCNQGIKRSSGKFVLLLNPDTVVEEDTFTKCLVFMSRHPEAGALGVKMINGNGKLLPESKRALPTPLTAFFKMTGLSKLFPGSRYFNRYYLGHINSYETAEADVLSGAFMFIRKSALDKTGLLDEDFFMYGEDIDLSYRLLCEGYKNYYFPEVKIIHYKGESTRKGDINYIVHFYNAMLIFIRKHFGRKKNLSLYLILNTAVLFWGLVSVLGNLYRKYFLAITDILTAAAGFALVIPLWEDFKFGKGYNYPRVFWLIIPAFCIVVVISIYLAGGYRSPVRISKVTKGLAAGVIATLAFYSMLPLELRFSRAVVVLGGLFALTFIPVLRLLLSFAGMKQIRNPLARPKKALIVCNEKEFNDIEQLLLATGGHIEVGGRISISSSDLGKEVLGSLDQISEIVRINRPDEIIFSSRELTASTIIEMMHLLSGLGIRTRIVPLGEKLLISSNSVHLNEKVFEIHSS